MPIEIPSDKIVGRIYDFIEETTGMHRRQHGEFIGL
jgi:hypothetical protein